MLHRLNEQGPLEDTFLANADFNVDFMGDGSVKTQTQVPVKFRLDVEYKSFGIQSISLVPIGTVSFEVEIDDYSQPDTAPKRTGEVVIDFDTMNDYEMYWKADSGITLSSMDVAIDDDMKVVDVILHATYIKMD